MDESAALGIKAEPRTEGPINKERGGKTRTRRNINKHLFFFFVWSLSFGRKFIIK